MVSQILRLGAASVTSQMTSWRTAGVRYLEESAMAGEVEKAASDEAHFEYSLQVAA